MKTKFLIIFLSIFCALKFSAQFHNTPPYQLEFNTGILNPNGSPLSMISVGSNDDVWKVSTTGNPGSYGPAVKVPYTGTGAPTYWGSEATTGYEYGWIGKNFGCGGDLANHGCNVPQGVDLYFRVVFSLPANPVLVLDWQVLADDRVVDIQVNGNTPFIPPSSANMNIPFNFRCCTGWLAGTDANTIVVHINSAAVPGTNNWAGLQIVSWGTQTNNPVGITGTPTVCNNTYNTYSIVPLVPNATSYQWSSPFSGGSSTSSTVMPYIGNSSGVIYAYASSSLGCIFAATMAVTPVIPTITVTPSPTAVCPGSPFTLTASGASTYSWITSTLSGSATVNPVTLTQTGATTYSVYGWDANGCRGRGGVLVGVLSPPTISITAYPGTICPGVSNILTASGASTYTWQPTGPNAITNVVTPTAMVPTSYTVVGTATTGCSNTAVVTLTPGVIIPITAPDVTLCTNASTNAIISASTAFNGGNVNYFWPSFSSQPTVVVSPAVNTIYTVVVTSTAGCTSSATLAVTITTNCCSQPTTGLTPLTSINNIAYSNTSYFVESSLVLSNSTLFENSEFLMMPGVQITVPPGMVLDLDHVHLYACGLNMWQGLVVQDGGQITAAPLRKGSSLVEDAVIAIDVENITSAAAIPIIDVNSIIFNKNYVGVKLNNASPSITSLPLRLTECVFSSRLMTFSSPAPFSSSSWPSADYSTGLRLASLSPTTGLASPYGLLGFAQTALKAPYLGQSANTGIQINNIGNQAGSMPTAGVDIGVTYPSGATDFNLFDGLQTCIDVQDASLTTMNNVFQNSTNGIYHRITGFMNAGLDLRPAGAGNQATDFGNRFWNCWIALQTKDVYDVNIEYGIFRSTHNTSTGFGPGSDGMVLVSNRFNYNVKYCEFNNIDYNFWATINTGSYNMGGNAYNGTYAGNITVSENYFGPEVASSLPQGGGYTGHVITLKGTNGANWHMAGISSILSNKIDRAYRGIMVVDMNTYPIEIGGNDIQLEDDYLVQPGDQYAIYVANSKDNLQIIQNVLKGHGTGNQNVKLVRSINNQAAGGGQSPVITCNQLYDAYLGFEFEKPQLNTVWTGNYMYQQMQIGLSLLNNGQIGTQGQPSPGLGCADKWIDIQAPFVWGPGTFQTYVDGGMPGSTFLYCENVPNAMPGISGMNGAGAGATPFMMGPSLDIGNNADCTYPNVYPATPSQRTMNSPATGNTIGAASVDWNPGVFPNPTNGNITITNDNRSEVLQVKVIDITGQTVLSKIITGAQANTLDLSALRASIYFIEIQGSDNKVVRKKIIKN